MLENITQINICVLFFDRLYFRRNRMTLPGEHIYPGADRTDVRATQYST